MSYIEIKNCNIQSKAKTLISNFSWTMQEGEAWFVCGNNKSGKENFISALSSELDFACVSDKAFYKNVFREKTALVSLEVAAKLIEEERLRDESEYIDKIDIGRTAREYICEVLGGSSKRHAPLPAIASRLETLPEVKLCGIENILDRGLHFMSTGEIRRTLLCRALLSNCSLIILSNPFEGLDTLSRKILFDFIETIVSRQLNASQDDFTFPRIILSADRFAEIPSSINKVLEFNDSKISFCGNRSEYETLLKDREKLNEKENQNQIQEFLLHLEKIREDSKYINQTGKEKTSDDVLISFNNVNVGWDEKLVLRNLCWQIKRGEHYLIQGPNGSGKTTMLELITGDNMQVFREDIKIFGKRRGTGETIWDIKKRLGIVSYRLHVEYRMVGGTSLINVIISGFKDSIGLYEIPGDYEKAIAREWLKLGGFAGRENETFSSLNYGEQRAILILRAAVKEPEVLILDEPCHGLDEDCRRKILTLLQKISETGTTTLLHVTHDKEEILPCEKHILLLNPKEENMFKIVSV